MKILGIDPGYAITGFGIIESEKGKLRFLDGGVVETSSDLAFPQRLEKIHTAVSELIQIHSPAAMAVEEIFLGRNKTTVIGAAEARGVVLLSAAENFLPVFEYTPIQVKKAITGFGKAEKFQVQLMVQKMLKLKELPKPDDMADALAIAICHSFMGGNPEYAVVSGYQRQMMKKKKRGGIRINIGKLSAQLEDLEKTDH